MTVSTFEGLSSGIEDDLNEFYDNVVSEVERIAGMLNGAADLVSTAISVLNPFDGINPFDSAVRRAIDKWNNEILPAINEMIQEVFDNVRDAVGDLAGRPLSLLDYSRAFNQVKGQVYTAGDMAQKLTLLEGSWQGRAFDNYRTVATSQDNALRDFALAMDAGGTATAEAARTILNLWRQLAREFIEYPADVLNILSTATEIDSILTFEIPALLGAAATIWQKVVDIGDILAEFMVEQATSGANSWQQLSTGARGLPQNKWPMAEEGNSDLINDPGQWAPTG